MKTLYKAALFVILLSCAATIFAQQTEREKAVELYKQGDYGSAVKILKKITKSDSSDVQSWYLLGLSYLKQEKEKDAENVLEKAVALDGNDANIHSALAYAYLLRNKAQQAQESAKNALTLNPDTAEAHYVLGVISFRDNLFNYAFERANKTIEINPNFAGAYLLKSEALVSSFAQQTGTVIQPKSVRSAFLNEAVESLEKYLSLSSNDEQTKYQREYLESLKFFAEYYSRPENQKPVSFDADSQADSNRTPLKILRKPRANYSQKARDAGVSGTIRLIVGFSADGKVKHILVIKPLGFGLDQEAIRAAREIRFEPATKDGKPISVVKIVEYGFTIF